MSGPTTRRPDGAAATRALIDRVPRWYHVLELPPGQLTTGVFDLRPITGRLPWPEVRGKRCLDVGAADGFFSFELERRGAAEVMATDVPRHEDWDWEPAAGDGGLRYRRHVFGAQTSIGFRTARRLLGSSVELEEISVYDLTPDRLGRFDVVVCGSLLLHLRDPLRALEAIRSVCAGQLLCTNQVDLVRSVTHRSQPLLRLDGTSGLTQWWLPNVAGHRQMLRASGFRILRESRLYSVPFGPAHPPPSRRPVGLARSLVRRLLTGSDGVPHQAVLAEPA